jgi:alkylated DNA repair dioxygenase AlkB
MTAAEETTTRPAELQGKNYWAECTTMPLSVYRSADSSPNTDGVDARVFKHLWNLHPEDYHHIKIYGKDTATPRYQQSYGMDYAFSGTVAKALPIPEGVVFNQVLLNWYQDGNHYIGSHADDEKSITPGSPIVTITFCRRHKEARVFRLRDFTSNTSKAIVHDIVTTHRKVIVMGGDFQKHFRHEIVKASSDARAAAMGKRISVTLRVFR